MADRTRSRTLLQVSPGYAYSYVNGKHVGTSVGGSGAGVIERCVDVTMKPPYTVDHPLTIEKYGCIGGPLRLQGNINGSFTRYDVQGYNPQNFSLAQYAPAETPVNWGYWRTKALANMNPNAPDVDVPLFLFELREFPKMLRDLGDVLRKKISPRSIPNGYLAYSFGWKPLVSDLLDLFNFADLMEKRKAYLRRLEHGGHVRRSLGTRTLRDSTVSGGHQVTFESQAIVRFDLRTHETVRAWYTANAKLLTPLPAASKLETLSRDLVLGLSVSPQTAWNALPWSWLIDYFANTGDLMQAARGGVAFKCTRMCVMATSEVSLSLSNCKPSNGNMSFTGGTLKRTIKRRAVYVNPRPQLTWTPILSGHQMSIIGALITARALKRP